MWAQGSNQLPAQTVVNPKGPNVTAISLRSKKSVEPTPKSTNKVVEPTPNPDQEVVVDIEKEKEYVPQIPFPQKSSEN